MTIDTIFLIVVFAISMIGSPGPANMALMAVGARYGYMKSIPFLLGTASGFLLVGMGVAAGIGALFEIFPALRITFLILSATYLIYLAYKIAFQSVKNGAREVRSGYLSGLFIHPLNPKAWAMMITAYSQFSPESLSPLMTFLIIQSIFQVTGLTLNSVWCAGGEMLARLVESPEKLKRINQSMAMAMLIIVGLSVWQSGMFWTNPHGEAARPYSWGKQLYK
ncbi:LysE family translocator [Sneathiella limimaris]|uniref:LysE family translocator n=1 Tax=Sneathiella limimaris TaxID=1964213 RepID=UPI00146C3665|nr:LysE family translocator [Sneathiella limimaris]